MPQLSGIYDSAWIQPVCRIKDNISILSFGQWTHYIADFIEGIPPGPASVVDMVAVAGATTLAANATITKRIVAVLQMNDLEFAHLRWEPLDNVEGVLWQLAGQARLNSRNIQSRVDLQTRDRDPHLATTTFWVIGQNRDMNLEVRNPMGVATPLARFMFWGWRYVLKPHTYTIVTREEKRELAKQGPEATKYHITPEEHTLLERGDGDTVRRVIGATSWVVAEGRQS